MTEVCKLISEIKSPPDEFTPVPFWFFNDAPDREEIERQLRDYVQKGVNGIVLHPRIGIPRELEYLSDEFFQAVRFIVETAHKLQMKIVLYDEGMYPSGSAHGQVAAANPAFSSRGIAIREELPPEGKGAKVIAKLSGERYLVSGFTHGTIRGIHFGEDDGEEGAPASADILNPQAVEKFIQLTHDRYYKELKEFFGHTIIGFFTDEPCALGRNAGSFREWAEGMEEEITAAGGTLQELEGLFTGKENKTTRIYRKLIKKHLRETFYAPLSRWCESHGISLMGHPEASDDVEEELYFHVPGQDLILRRVVPQTGGIREFDSVQAKLSADIARHLGRRRNSNECFGVCNRQGIPWYFTGEDMKWYLDWLGIRGVNLFIPHAFYYSVAGRRKDERPPDVGPHNIWWKHYRILSDYMKRLSYLMTDSVNGARVAVLCDNNRVPCEQVAALYENQIEFNYLPAALLPQCHVEEGRLCIGEYRYEVVLNVLGEACRGLPPEILEIHGADALLNGSMGNRLRTVMTETACPNLRAVRLAKNGVEMYLLSNEGKEEIRTGLVLPGVESPLVLMNLWDGTYACAEAENRPEGTRLQVVLPHCETLLILLDREGEIRETRKREQFLGDWTGAFAEVKREKNRAEYEAVCSVERPAGTETFEIRGEEMAECWCNGRFAGVSFWNPHRFQVGPFLRAGENQIQLVFTGSAANQYGGADLFFGMEPGANTSAPGGMIKNRRKKSEGILL